MDIIPVQYRIYLQIIIVLAVALFSFAGGVRWQQTRDDKKELQEIKQSIIDTNKTIENLQAISKSTQDSLSVMQPKYVTINNKVEREVKTNVVYRDCILPDSGRLLRNAAATGNIDPAELKRALSAITSSTGRTSNSR